MADAEHGEIWWIVYNLYWTNFLSVSSPAFIATFPHYFQLDYKEYFFYRQDPLDI
jgi:hypothetical protein